MKDHTQPKQPVFDGTHYLEATSRVRALLVDFAQASQTNDHVLDVSMKFIKTIGQLSAEAQLKVMLAALEDTNPFVRVFAASTILSATADTPDLVADKRTIATASSILEDSLDSTNQFMILIACVLLAASPIPKGCAERLQKFLESPEEDLRVLAAAALSGTRENLSTILPLLKNGLRSDVFLIQRTSALGLMRLRAYENEVYPFLCEVLRETGVGRRYSVLLAIKHAGSSARGLAEPVAELVGDLSAPSEVRMCAAATLGVISRGSTIGLPSLIQALQSNDSQLVWGATQALSDLNMWTVEIVKLLGTLLESPDRDVREAAADALADCGSLIDHAAEILLARLKHEPDGQVLTSVTYAAAKLGERAIPELMEMMRSGDPRQFPIAGCVFAHMGSTGAIALAQALSETKSVYLMSILIATLRDMGAQAAPAVRLLGSILKETPEEELALLIAKSLANIGPTAQDALDGLIDCLLNRSDEAADWAERAIWQVGPPAQPLLLKALSQAPSARRERIERSLAVFHRPTDHRFRAFVRFNDDVSLQRFVYVGDVLNDAGGPVAYPKMATILKARLSDEKSPASRGLKAGTLRAAVKAVEHGFHNVHLLSVRPGAKGMLTPAGQRLYRKAREYLACKKKARADGWL